MTHSGAEAIEHVVSRAAVPVWIARMPGVWLCSGIGYAGDDRISACAVAVCLTGPSPLGGGAEVVLVAEEPGVGLGARYAGLAEADAHFDTTPPDVRVMAAGHPAPLWNLPGPADRAVFVGEAKGHWLWVVVHPAAAGVVMYDEPVFTDAAEVAPAAELEFGSVSALLFEQPSG
jgi:hypothetical protein